MKAKLLNSEPKEASISVTEADIGILYIVQHEILSSSKTNFAGVIVKHPLTNECWMNIKSSAEPMGEVKKAAESAIKAAEDLKRMFYDTIKVD